MYVTSRFSVLCAQILRALDCNQCSFRLLLPFCGLQPACPFWPLTPTRHFPPHNCRSLESLLSPLFLTQVLTLNLSWCPSPHLVIVRFVICLNKQLNCSPNEVVWFVNAKRFSNCTLHRFYCVKLSILSSDFQASEWGAKNKTHKKKKKHVEVLQIL